MKVSKRKDYLLRTVFSIIILHVSGGHYVSLIPLQLWSGI